MRGGGSVNLQASSFVDELVTRCTEPGLAARYSDVSQVLAALAEHDPSLRERSRVPQWHAPFLEPVKAFFCRQTP